MPCFGPTADESRAYERRNNKDKFGKAWDDEQLAFNVACALGKAMDAVYDNELPTAEIWDNVPKWARLWWEDHKKRDAQIAKARKEEAEKRKKKLLTELKDTLGELRSLGVKIKIEK